MADEEPQAQEGAVEAPQESDDRSLVFIEPSPDERARVEALGDEFGRQVWAVNPVEFSLEMVESFNEAAAVVVAFDLGGRPGLDLVTTLARDSRLAGIRIALSADAPTAALVRAAWRSGARSVLTRPYAADEITARLLSSPPGPAEG